MANYSDYITAVEVMSGSTNKVIFDDVGLPSIMVAFPKLKYSDVFDNELATDETLPAFIVDGIENDVIWVSKYQNIVINNRAYSLPNKDPKSSIPFNTSVQVCRQKGNGWSLMPNSVWAAIALWCKKNKTIPYGNTSHGQYFYSPWEKGLAGAKETSGQFRLTRTKTGSGPATWYHNHNYSGISDFASNVFESQLGFRILNGEINIIPNSDCMLQSCDISMESPDWKAVLEDGTLVDVGTDGSIKFSFSSTGWTLDTISENQSNLTRNIYFHKITNGDITPPKALMALAIIPHSSNAEDYGKDYCGIRNGIDREYVPARGANFEATGVHGMFTILSSYNRATKTEGLGFRSAFCQN